MLTISGHSNAQIAKKTLPYSKRLNYAVNKSGKIHMSHDKEFKLYNENDFSEEFTLEYVRFDIDKKDISILNENLTMVLKDEFSSKIKFDIISIHAMLLNPSFEAYVKSMKNTKEKLLIFSYFI